MKKKIKNILFASFSVMALMVSPLAVFLSLFSIPSQFSDTYYGELKAMKDNLSSKEKKKIVVIGNSSVAFGLDSNLMQEELLSKGYDYDVCSFGLYGALGTKAMMELSLPYVREGDIVILAPEVYSQSLSLYFSGKEFWYAADSDLSLIYALDSEDRQKMVGSMNSYLSEKYSYFKKKEKPAAGTVYAKSSFDSNCVLNQVERKDNQMADGIDSDNLIDLDISLYTDDFVSYVNQYVSQVRKKNGTVFYSWSPMNLDALKEGQEDKTYLSEFETLVDDKLDCPLLSPIQESLLGKGYFYDSNYHLNDTGMEYHTLTLCEDLLNQWGCSEELSRSYPEEPSLPEREDDSQDGDNQDDDCFSYSLKDDGTYSIISLSEAGKKKSNLVIPYRHEGKLITSFAADVFQNDTVIETITIQENIISLKDYSFQGSSVKKIHLLQNDPEKISVGYSLLEGTENVKIQVASDSLSLYLNNYFWGHYGSNLVAYTK